jgi:plasmid replication initiation protein
MDGAQHHPPQPHLRPTQHPRRYRRWDVEFDDGQHPYRVGCLALPEYGVPHGIDNDIMTALINLFIEQGCPTDNAVTASAYACSRRPDTPTGAATTRTSTSP